MIGNMYWNLFFAAGGGIITFLFSWSVNPFATAMWRSIFCFLILFIFMFAVRFFLGSIAGIRLPAEETEQIHNHEQAIGQNVDVTTPDETEDFTPLTPDEMAQDMPKKSEDEGR